MMRSAACIPVSLLLFVAWKVVQIGQETGRIYVYDPDGDKIRVVQFYGAGLLRPTSLFFAGPGRLLVAPGCYEFRTAP
jgi:hypothetical protein